MQPLKGVAKVAFISFLPSRILKWIHSIILNKHDKKMTISSLLGPKRP